MARAPRLGRGGLLAALGAVVAVACAPETIDLLPMEDARGGGSGQSGSAGSTSAGGVGTSGLSGGGQAGASAGGGAAGTNDGSGGGGCQGMGCGGNASAGYGGFNCPYGPSCTPCESDVECHDGKVCDPGLEVCVQCWNDEQCLNDQDQSTRYCINKRCIECFEHSQCTKGERQRCHPTTLRCVECFFDEDCDFDERCELGYCQ